MQLNKVKICGFKSFNDECVIHLDTMSALVGRNSSGKTSFFNALLRMFGETPRDREVKKTDFHFSDNYDLNGVSERKFYIECEFTFHNTLGEGGAEKYIIPQFIDNFIINSETGDPYIRIRLEAVWKKSNNPEGIIEKQMFFIVTNKPDFNENEKHTISKEILSKIKFVYIPATRNPQVQLKNASGSILWRLLNSIQIDDEFKSVIDEKLSDINLSFKQHEGINRINSLVESQWQRYHTDARYKNVDFSFNISDIESILNKIEPNFNPTETGDKYGIDDIGDGLKSLFYFSLVGALLKIEEETLQTTLVSSTDRQASGILNIEPPFITILGVEEPENHISPYILGKIIKNLYEISGNFNSQVIVSSHSTSIIKRINVEQIRYFSICSKNKCTNVSSIVLPTKEEEAFKYVKEAIQAYPELYFSNLVILGEGDSEEVVIPEVLKVMGIDIVSNEIAIVPLGGRHVNHFWKLLSQLNIPYITLLDLDLERGGGGFGRIKYALEQLIKNGQEYEELLLLSDGNILSKDDFKEMHTWADKDSLRTWIDYLRKYNVYFSEPLDLDYMLLEHFKQNYIELLKDGQGPTIKINQEIKYIANLEEQEFKSQEYKNKLKSSIAATLKSDEKEGVYFTDEQKALMIWYQYFFLYRGKPVIHRLALNTISSNILKIGMPKMFVELSQRVKEILEG